MKLPHKAKQSETPGERADKCGQEGYRVTRIGGGIYLVQRPDGTRTYRVDVIDRRCNCQSTAWWGCKHILYCDYFRAYDKAVADMETARRRDVLVAECEDALDAAEWHLRRVMGEGAERWAA